MRSYLWTTCAIFVLITVAHVARVAAEGLVTLKDPLFAISSVITIAMALWSARLLRSSRRRGGLTDDA